MWNRSSNNPLVRVVLITCLLAGLGAGLFFGLSGGKKKMQARHTRKPAGVLTGSIDLRAKTWHCRGPVDLRVVRVTMDATSADAVHLDSGCTGTIHSLEIAGDGGHVGPGGDGVKIHRGVHDLEVLGGEIDCGARSSGKHQDAVQAMGGSHVTFHNITSRWCRNSFMFINRGNHKRGVPTGIVCTGCRAQTRNYSVFIGHSIRSGAEDSTFVSRVRPKVLPEAVDPVADKNTWTSVSVQGS